MGDRVNVRLWTRCLAAVSVATTESLRSGGLVHLLVDRADNDTHSAFAM